MTRFPSWLWLVLTVVFAAAASLAWIMHRSPPPPTPREMAKVVVAKAGPATRLTPDQLKVEDWPPEGVPKGAFPRVEMLEGRVTA
jgi:Flp pilus assembly protein CpaB